MTNSSVIDVNDVHDELQGARTNPVELVGWQEMEQRISYQMRLIAYDHLDKIWCNDTNVLHSKTSFKPGQ